MDTTPLRDALLDALFPPRCASCRSLFGLGERGRGPLGLCGPCDAQLVTIDEACRRCGVPGDDAPTCAACTAHPVGFDAARASFVHLGPVTDVLHRFKYGDRPDLARPLAATMAALDLPPVDVVAPVPLHASRRRRRTYDQALWLARELASLKGLPFEPGLVRRIRATAQQVGQDRAARVKNVADAFVAEDGVKGRTVLLVDDVVTTGATASAAAVALKAAGARTVVVVSVSRAA